MAFLEGQAAIRYPVEATGDVAGQRVLPGRPAGPDHGRRSRAADSVPAPAGGRAHAVRRGLWGLATDGQLLFAIIGAIDVGIAWWILGRLPIRTAGPGARHDLLRLRDGVLVCRPDRDDVVPGPRPGRRPGAAVDRRRPRRGPRRGARRGRAADEPRPGAPAPHGRLGGAARRDRGVVRAGPRIDRRQFLAGLLFGLACTSRLTVVFAAPFFLLVGSGGSWQRRGWSAALGAGIPLGLLVVYNLVATGHVFHPGYEYLYQLEAGFYTPLNYNLDWGIEDPRYLPQNLAIMFLNTPVWLPDDRAVGARQWRGPVHGPGRRPRPLRSGLPARPAARHRDEHPPHEPGLPPRLARPCAGATGRSRLVTGAALAVVLVALVNLMHFSQGWVQFGYRFSNDFVAVGARSSSRSAWSGSRPGPALGRRRSPSSLVVRSSVRGRTCGASSGATRSDGDRRRPCRRGRAAPGSRPLGVGAVALGLCLWRVMPGVGVLGHRPSSRRSCPSWGRPTRPATRPTSWSAGSRRSS